MMAGQYGSNEWEQSGQMGGAERQQGQQDQDFDREEMRELEGAWEQQRDLEKELRRAMQEDQRRLARRQQLE